MLEEKVVSPVGLPDAVTSSASKRLGDLDGKVIAEIWNGDFKGDVTFPLIRAKLLQHYPTLRIVPYSEFPHTHVSDDPARQRERAGSIAAQVKAMGCDAVISGVGA